MAAAVVSFAEIVPLFVMVISSVCRPCIAYFPPWIVPLLSISVPSVLWITTAIPFESFGHVGWVIPPNAITKGSVKLIVLYS